MKYQVPWKFNTSPNTQFGTRIGDNIFKCIFFDEHILILIEI